MEVRPVPRQMLVTVTVAPGGLKVGSGENPNRSYGEDKRAPGAGVGNVGLQRAASLKTKKLQTDWARRRDEESRRIATEAKERSPAMTRRVARHRSPPLADTRVIGAASPAARARAPRRRPS
ncbi:hypothetical protein [Sorangium sp. So ce1024]|uniref:hypothetical protein n=1 Tax=unclassified Sorangium TaxID=2621164 RepID=UPI003F094848